MEGQQENLPGSQTKYPTTSLPVLGVPGVGHTMRALVSQSLQERRAMELRAEYRAQSDKFYKLRDDLLNAVKTTIQGFKEHDVAKSIQLWVNSSTDLYPSAILKRVEDELGLATTNKNKFRVMRPAGNWESYVTALTDLLNTYPHKNFLRDAELFLKVTLEFESALESFQTAKEPTQPAVISNPDSQKNIETLTQEVSKLKELATQDKEKIKTLESENSRLNKALEKKSKKVETQKTEIAALKEEVISLKVEKASSVTKAEELVKQNEDLRQRIASLEAQVKDQTEQERKTLDVVVETLNETRGLLNTTHQQMSRLEDSFNASFNRSNISFAMPSAPTPRNGRNRRANSVGNPPSATLASSMGFKPVQPPLTPIKEVTEHAAKADMAQLPKSPIEQTNAAVINKAKSYITGKNCISKARLEVFMLLGRILTSQNPAVELSNPLYTFADGAVKKLANTEEGQPSSEQWLLDLQEQAASVEVVPAFKQRHTQLLNELNSLSRLTIENENLDHESLPKALYNLYGETAFNIPSLSEHFKVLAESVKPPSPFE